MKEGAQRYHLLDEIRGFAIICMVFFHGFYLMAEVFGWGIGETLLKFFTPAEPFFAAAFVLMSGISSRLSRNNALRGAKLLWLAIGLTLVTYGLQLAGVKGVVIWFGILHLLAVSMLFYAALGKWLDKIHPAIIIPVCILIFAVTFNLESGYIGIGSLSADLPQTIRFNRQLFPFGITAPGFFSADYFPILPWLFMFIIGTVFGRAFEKGAVPKIFSRSTVPVFGWCGKKSLIIYLAHQPILFGIFYVLDRIMP